MIEYPKTEKVESSTKESVTTHPAFAQIGASRVSGNTNLYDSDFRHQHYMTITIRRSQLNRGLHRDWHFGDEQLIEVALTESQWANFVSAPNMGSGVPCTLQRLYGKSVPQLPTPEARNDQFAKELTDNLSSLVERMADASSKIEEMKLPKGKSETLKGMFHDAVRQIQSNIPFIVSQFDKHMEGTEERAKSEIHGYMNSVLQRAGLEALASPENLPLAIENKNDR